MSSNKPLKDPKKEKLAYALGFCGARQAVAAKSAGYEYAKMHTAEAVVSKLLKTPEFKARVEWWRAERERQEAEVRAISAETGVVDEAWIIAGLKRLAQKAEAAGDVNAARACLVDLGKTRAMFVDKSINQNQSLDQMPDDELRAQYEAARRERRAALKVVSGGDYGV